MQPRILLHAMTFKRDFGFVYCLAKVLDGLGCQTIVCSNTDYVSRPMRLWRPDVVFYETIGRTDMLRRAYPHTNLILWNAESCRLGTHPPFELKIAGDPDRYRGLSRVLLWGKGAKELILQHAQEQQWRWILDDLATFDRKFVPVGHPRLDLSRYGMVPRQQGDRVRIGFIGLCSSLNNVILPPLKYLLDVHEQTVPGDPKEDMYFEAKYFDLMAQLVHNLGPEHYSFSLRPYPLENMTYYGEANLVKSGRLTLDDSIEFTSWVNKQDLIIGAVSTTMYLIAASNKAYINIDQLLNRPMGARVFANEYLAAIPEYCPRTQEQFMHMVQHFQDFRIKIKPGTILDRQLATHISSGEDLPVLFQMARQMINAAHAQPAPRGLPFGCCARLNELHCRYAEMRGLNQKRGNYSHFRRAQILPRAEAEFGRVVRDILAAIPEEERKRLHD